MGARTNRQIFEETPIAVIEAAAATEQPFCVRMKGSETVINPWLIPEGKTRKRKVNGLAVVLLYVILRYFSILFGGTCSHAKRFIIRYEIKQILDLEQI